jgi:hypothetical protein
VPARRRVSWWRRRAVMWIRDKAVVGLSRQITQARTGKFRVSQIRHERTV